MQISPLQKDQLRQYHNKNIWVCFAIIILGLWQIVAPITFGYASSAMSISSIIAGIAVIMLGLIAVKKTATIYKWLVCAVGFWLQIAPLIFWAPKAVAYLNDTLVGALLITLAIVVPHKPTSLEKGPFIPPGWSYNPSSWHQRMPIIFFGLIGWFLARYMASYQLGYVDTVNDPFFGDGTLRVITSDIAKSFPVSDAGLGALAYSLEAILAAKGSSKRWHSMPWIVVFFGFLVVPLGFVSILLVISQPVFVGAWCGLCLMAALCMLLMMSLTIDEVAAVVQTLILAKKDKQPFWQIFWRGPQLDSDDKVENTPSYNEPLSKHVPAMFEGTSMPFNLLITALIGIWLMFAPAVCKISSLAADVDHIFGALIITFSVVSFAEVARSLRYLVTFLAVILLISTWFLTGSTMLSTLNDALMAILLIILSLPKGKITKSYGYWNRWIK